MDSANSNQTFQVSTASEGLLFFLSRLPGFVRETVLVHMDYSAARTVIKCSGRLPELDDSERSCPVCHHKMHIKSTRSQVLRNLPAGAGCSHAAYDTAHLRCKKWGHSHMRQMPFKSENHFITTALKNFVEDLPVSGQFTLKAVAEMTDLGQQTVSQIDKARLSALYTEGDSDHQTLKKPCTYSRHLAIDEFKLHDGHKYATHISALKRLFFLFFLNRLLIKDCSSLSVLSNHNSEMNGRPEKLFKG